MAGKKPPKKVLTIEGVTKEGQRIRPGDWAERLGGSMATFRGGRVKYSPLLQPSVNADGYKCLLLDPALEQSNPELYNTILKFAERNNLHICQDDEDNTNN